MAEGEYHSHPTHSSIQARTVRGIVRVCVKEIPDLATTYQYIMVTSCDFSVTVKGLV